jgi:hypothetical protein
MSVQQRPCQRTSPLRLRRSWRRRGPSRARSMTRPGRVRAPAVPPRPGPDRRQPASRRASAGHQPQHLAQASGRTGHRARGCAGCALAAAGRRVRFVTKALAILQQRRCKGATMVANATRSGKRMPRWWRRLLVALRRANVFLLLEMTAGTALITMLAVSWQTVSATARPTSCCRRGSLRCCWWARWFRPWR